MAAMQKQHLVKMANQIAVNFGERRDVAEAARKTGEHLEKFWTRDMRAQLLAHRNAGGEELSAAVDLYLQRMTND